MTLYWIDRLGPGRIAIMARPRAGDWLADEIAGWRADGVDEVVCLLEADEIAELDIVDEPRLCAEAGMRFWTFPIPDRGVPAEREALGLAKDIASQVQSGRAVAIHCRAGIGRSSVMAALVMITLGEPAADVFDRISTARRLEVPDTTDQRTWVLSLAEEMGGSSPARLSE